MTSSSDRRKYSIAPLFVAALLTFFSSSSWSYRVIAQPEDAHEFLLSQITLPLSTTDFIRFNNCSNCVASSMRVTPATRYSLNGLVLPLDKLREAVIEILENYDDNDTMATVYYDTDSLATTRVAVEYFQ